MSDLRGKLGKPQVPPIPSDSPFSAAAPTKVAAAPTIPRDSPFANCTSSSSNSLPQASAPAAPFTFSFALDTSGPKKTALATYNLAAPIAADPTKAVPPAAASGATKKGSLKIRGAKRGKQGRPSKEEDDEEGGGDDDGRSEGEGGDARLHPSSAASGEATHGGSASSNLSLGFDSSKFDLSGFAMSLPEAPLPVLGRSSDDRSAAASQAGAGSASAAGKGAGDGSNGADGSSADRLKPAELVERVPEA